MAMVPHAPPTAIVVAPPVGPAPVARWIGAAAAIAFGLLLGGCALV